MAAENSGRSTFKAPPENAPLCVWVDKESTSGVRCFKRLLALELCGVCRFYERASLRARILFLVYQCDGLACWHVAERGGISQARRSRFLGKFLSHWVQERTCAVPGLECSSSWVTERARDYAVQLTRRNHQGWHSLLDLFVGVFPPCQLTQNRMLVDLCDCSDTQNVPSAL